MEAESRARVRRGRLAALVVASGVLLGGCARHAPQDTLKPAGPLSHKIDNLFFLTFWIAVVVFVVVEGGIVLAVLRGRHRARRDPEAIPAQTHGHLPIEITWTVIPAILLLALAVPTVKTIFDLARKPKGDPLEITVVGHQWWWEYRYPSLGVTTANELHIPTDRPVYLNLESVDVIHSFWVPKLNGKRDVVPGRINHLNLRAVQPGTYYGQCVEYCGASHANMRLRAVAQTPADFRRWVDDQRRAPSAPTGQAAQGLAVFEAKPCIGCHTINGISEGNVGPNLTHLQSRTTFAGAIFAMSPQNLAAWLRDPPGEKPGSRMPNLHLTEDEIAKLVAYLETLK